MKDGGKFTLIDPKTGIIIKNGVYAEEAAGLCSRPDPTAPVRPTSIMLRIADAERREHARVSALLGKI